MNSKPLTYDSLKTVLLYMEPSIRFLLSSRAPSITVTDRVVPLKINDFRIELHSIKINQNVYEYQVYQVDCKDKLPYKVSGYSRLNGRWNCNVDEFGIRDYINEADGMVPGNNGLRETNLFGEFDLKNIPTNKARLKKLKRRLSVERKRSNQLSNYRSAEKPSNNNNSIRDFIEIRHDDAQNTKEELELLKNGEMIHVTYRQGNSEPCVIERLEYTGGIHKAGESLMKFMFAKRGIILLNKLSIVSECRIRMPLDLKIMVKYLELVANVSSKVEMLKLIMDESSCDQLNINFDSEDTEELDQEFIGHFTILVVEGNNQLTLPFIQSLPNQTVEFKNLSVRFLQSDDFIILIRSWMETNKPLGTSFTFQTVIREPDVLHILERVLDEFEESRAGEQCVDIPMNNDTVLKISYGRRNGYSLMIKMDVVPLDY
uniref:F-box C protein n=1 Tax=Caenorhabditis tropicalis TaxID=1561998 RepID=A0A1I7TAK8_9PELO